MDDAGGEDVTLEPSSCLQHPRRDAAGRGPPSRRQALLELPRQIEPVSCKLDGLLSLGRFLDIGEEFPETDKGLMPVGRELELEPYPMREIARSLSEPALEIGRYLGGVEAWRQRDDSHIESACRRELHAAQRCRFAGGVGIEAEVDPPRQATELSDLRLGQGGAHRRDDGLEPRLAQGEDIGVSLDDAGALLLGDSGACAVEAVDELTLLEQLTL